MRDRVDEQPDPDKLRRSLLLGGGVVAGMALAGTASGQTEPHEVSTDNEPRMLGDQPVPEPPAERSARAGLGCAGADRGNEGGIAAGG